MSGGDGTQPLITVRDPEAHLKLDQIYKALVGDVDGKKGMIEIQREHASKLDDHEHRITKLEGNEEERSKWIVRTTADKIIWFLGSLACGGFGYLLTTALQHKVPHP